MRVGPDSGPPRLRPRLAPFGAPARPEKNRRRPAAGSLHGGETTRTREGGRKTPDLAAFFRPAPARLLLRSARLACRKPFGLRREAPFPASERDAGRPHAAAGARRGPADASTGREKASVRPGLSAEGARCLVAELAARAFCFLSASDAVNVICGLLAAAAPRLQRYRRRSAGLEPGTRSSATCTC